MSLPILELSDGGLRLLGIDGREVHQPALALAQGGELRLGTDALAQARRAPQALLSEHFGRMSIEPLRQPLAQARTHADVVHAQLQALWQAGGGGKGQGVVLAVPSLLNREQLALLLGIAEACDFEAQGLVDTALVTLAGTGTLAEGAHYVLDGGLNQGYLSTVTQDGTHLTRTAVTPLPAAALTDLEDSWVGAVADGFITETRFDPLHTGDSEQALYDVLPGWLEALQTAPSLEANLTYGGQRFTVTLNKAALLERVTGRYDALLDTLKAQHLADGTLWIHERLTRFPGLLARLSNGLSCPCRALAAKGLATGAASLDASLLGTPGALTYVTALDRAPGGGTAAASPTPAGAASAASAQAQTGAPAPSPLSPTHALLGAVAVPLPADGALPLGGKEGPFRALDLPALGTVQRAQDGWQLTPASGQRARLEGLPLGEATPLALGMAVHFETGSLTLRLIRVEAP